MKPYGRLKTVKFAGKTDHRIRIKNKKVANWWEDICKLVSRKKIKQDLNKQITTEI